jgi:lysophospholipase L1-like esterase
VTVNLLVIGDSVVWGQGLLDGHKFSKVVADKVGAMKPQNYSHSGAVIGTHNTIVADPVNGEVPVPLPSIIQQLQNCKDPQTIDLVIVNGGINDIGVAKILSPWTTKAELDLSIDAHCGRDMLSLLQQIGAVIIKPGAKVVVPGYYTILSPDSTHYSDILQVVMLLEMHGVAGSFALAQGFDSTLLLGSLTANCHEFFVRSTTNLTNAVAQANQQFKGNPQFVFVPLPFTDQNAVFASHPLLWGIKPNLQAQDEVVAQRRPQCDIVFHGRSEMKRQQCYRASAGHPNVKGATVIATAIIAAL